MATETERTTAVPVGGTLRDWEIGLIAANVIVIVVLLGLVGVCLAYFVFKRRVRPGPVSSSRKQDVEEKSKPRPVSMIEQIQLMEEEVEEVDFGGE